MNKSLKLLVFAVLSLAILSSFASSAVTFSNPIISSNTTFTVTATSSITSGTETISTLVPVLTDSSGTNYTPSLVGTPNLTFDYASGDLTEAITYTIPSGFSFQSSGSLASFTLNGTGTTVTPLSYTFENQPQTITTCQLTGNQGNHLDLSVDSTDIISGYGSSTNWYPLDDIEARVIVTNNGPDTIKNIVVKWILYDTTTKKKIMSGSEDSFNLRGNNNYEKTLDINFKLDSPNNLDNGDNYALYVWATGNDEFYDGNPSTCSSDNSDSININIDSHFVILDSLTIPDSASCGGTAQITGTAWNIGSYDERNTYLIVSSTQLGINQRVDLGDINSEDNQDFSFLLNIPDDTPKGTYSLDVSVYNNAKTIFKNDNGDKSESQLILNINNTCSTVPLVSISANLESSQAKAGQDLIVRATIINTGSTTSTFNLDLSDYSNWASLVNMDRNSVTLNAGESQDVLITLKANDDTSGDQKFNLNVKDGSKTLSQPVSVTIQSGSSFPDLTGFFSKVVPGSSWTLVIGGLNALLIIVIIAIAIRIKKKK